jgi:aquaporin Z
MRTEGINEVQETRSPDSDLADSLHRSQLSLWGLVAALRRHYPEYLIEGWAFGMFTTLFEYPGSPLRDAIQSGDLRRMFIGIAMGLTAIALIYSPWGQRSGAHMNPAVTLTFWRLGKVTSSDALFYVLAQFIGGTLGVVLTQALLQSAFTALPVYYVVTLPGAWGVASAFSAEVVISALLMWMVLNVSNSTRYAKFTGLCAGLMVATYISIEAPLSGMSMNPARSFASAWPAREWTHFWIYLIAPVLGMQSAAGVYVLRRTRANGCAKLQHPANQRCIHCGYEPMTQHDANRTYSGELS